jgi:hypothetical protein
MAQSLVLGTVDGTYAGYAYASMLKRQGFRVLADLLQLGVPFQSTVEFLGRKIARGSSSMLMQHPGSGTVDRRPPPRPCAHSQVQIFDNGGNGGNHFKSDHCFDAVLSAYTAYLWARDGWPTPDGCFTDDGWIGVDPATFATKFVDVYAVGDVTSAPVPRAGGFAEGEARTVADVLLERLGGGDPASPFQGEVTCYLDIGDGTVARVDVNFLGGSAPTGVFRAASHEHAAEKEEFGASRRRRWFGYSE